jgi:bile acid:Na+ symporter, BASS family
MQMAVRLHGAMDVRRILGNSAIMMTLSFITALVMGGFPSHFVLTNGNIAMLSLMVMMSLSLTSLQLRGLRVLDHAASIHRAFLLSFVLSSGITILMAFLFQGELREGWIIEAAVPSAVSVVPFTYLMKGDLEPTLVSTAAIYVIALAFTPVLTLLFLGQPIDEGVLLLYVGLLILLPMGVSRLLRRVEISQENKGAAINVSFFVLIVAVAGPNRQVFFNDGTLLSGLIAVAIVRIFVIGLLCDWYLRRKHVPRGQRVPEVLFSTYKNTGMAATLALALIGPAAAVPATVCTVVEITWLIFLSRYVFRG